MFRRLHPMYATTARRTLARRRSTGIATIGCGYKAARNTATIRKRSCRRKYATRFTMTDVGLTEGKSVRRVLMKIPSCILDTGCPDALHALTELRGRFLFRTIINGESSQSVAQDKQCSSRNIRICEPVRSQIRPIKRREGYGRPSIIIIILLFMLLLVLPLACWGEQLWTTVYAPPAETVRLRC